MEQNITIKQRLSDNTYDTLYPQTKANLVTTESGDSTETYLENLQMQVDNANESSFHIGDIKQSCISQDSSWLLCDGNPINQENYPDLFDVMETHPYTWYDAQIPINAKLNSANRYFYQIYNYPEFNKTGEHRIYYTDNLVYNDTTWSYKTITTKARSKIYSFTYGLNKFIIGANFNYTGNNYYSKLEFLISDTIDGEYTSPSWWEQWKQDNNIIEGDDTYYVTTSTQLTFLPYEDKLYGFIHRYQPTQASYTTENYWFVLTDINTPPELHTISFLPPQNYSTGKVYEIIDDYFLTYAYKPDEEGLYTQAQTYISDNLSGTWQRILSRYTENAHEWTIKKINDTYYAYMEHCSSELYVSNSLTSGWSKHYFYNPETSSYDNVIEGFTCYNNKIYIVKHTATKYYSVAVYNDQLEAEYGIDSGSCEYYTHFYDIVFSKSIPILQKTVQNGASMYSYFGFGAITPRIYPNPTEEGVYYYIKAK